MKGRILKVAVRGRREGRRKSIRLRPASTSSRDGDQAQNNFLRLKFPFYSILRSVQTSQRAKVGTSDGQRMQTNEARAHHLLLPFCLQLLYRPSSQGSVQQTSSTQDNNRELLLLSRNSLQRKSERKEQPGAHFLATLLGSLALQLHLLFSLNRCPLSRISLRQLPPPQISLSDSDLGRPAPHSARGGRCDARRPRTSIGAVGHQRQNALQGT